jgi:protein transport protein SEC24
LLLLVVLQMLVVTELDDPFLPMPDDLLVNLRDSKELVDALLDALPSGYSASTSNDVAMGPALQVARVQDDMLHGHCCLRLLAVHGALQKQEGPELHMTQAACTTPEQARAGSDVSSVVACLLQVVVSQ